jgi:hypothetical protein
MLAATPTNFASLGQDLAFIKSINRNAGSLKIVRSIVMLAHSLGLMVTAECQTAAPLPCRQHVRRGKERVTLTLH